MNISKNFYGINVTCIEVSISNTNDTLFVCFPGVTTFWLYFSQPSSGLSPPRFRGFLITHDDTPQSVGPLWTSDQLVAETST